MKRLNDVIQMESRWEIDELVDALETYLSEHKNSRSKDTVNKLKDLLDCMYMEW